MFYKQPRVVRVEPKLTKREAAQLKKDKVQVDASHIDVWVKDETVRYEKPDGSTLLTRLIAKDNVPYVAESDAAYGIYREVAKTIPSRAAALGLPVKHGVKKNGTLDLVSRVDRNHPRLKYARDGFMGAMDPRKKLVPWTRLSKYDVNLIPPVLAHAQTLNGIYAAFRTGFLSAAACRDSARFILTGQSVEQRSAPRLVIGASRRFRTLRAAITNQVWALSP